MNFDDFEEDDCTGDEMDTEELLGHFDHLEALFNSEKFGQAVTYLGHLIHEEPRAPEWYSFRARAYSELGRHDLALKDVGAIQVLAPELPDTHLVSALVNEAAGDVSKALEHLKRARECAFNDSETMMMIGAMQADWGAVKDAFETYSSYLETHPGNAQFVRYRAVFRAMLGDSTKAIRELDSLIEAHPKDAHAYHSRGAIYERHGKTLQALRDYRHAARVAQCDCKSKFASLAARLHRSLENVG